MSEYAFIPGLGFNASIATLLPMPCVGLDYPDDLIKQKNVFLSRACALIPKNSTLIGWSLGGLLAIQFCHAFPRHCHKLILLSTTPLFSEIGNWPGITTENANNIQQKLSLSASDFSDYFLKLLTFPIRKKIARDNLTKHYSTPTAHNLTFLFVTDLREIYANLVTPTTLHLAENDAIIPSTALSKVCSKLNPNINISIIKNASHACFINNNAILREIMSSC